MKSVNLKLKSTEMIFVETGDGKRLRIKRNKRVRPDDSQGSE